MISAQSQQAPWGKDACDHRCIRLREMESFRGPTSSGMLLSKRRQPFLLTLLPPTPQGRIQIRRQGRVTGKPRCDKCKAKPQRRDRSIRAPSTMPDRLGPALIARRRRTTTSANPPGPGCEGSQATSMSAGATESVRAARRKFRSVPTEARCEHHFRRSICFSSNVHDPYPITVAIANDEPTCRVSPAPGKIWATACWHGQPQR